MHTEPMSVIPTTRPRRLYRVLTWLAAAAVAIGMSYARAADIAAPTCAVEAERIRSELAWQELPKFNDQAGRYLADTLNQLYAYGTLPNRYVPERQANWEPGANRPVMMQKRSIGGDPWGRPACCRRTSTMVFQAWPAAADLCAGWQAAVRHDHHRKCAADPDAALRGHVSVRPAASGFRLARHLDAFVGQRIGALRCRGGRHGP